MQENLSPAHQASPTSERLLTINEFCARYKIGRTKTYKLIAAHQLKTTTIGRARRITVDSAEALIVRSLEPAVETA